MTTPAGGDEKLEEKEEEQEGEADGGGEEAGGGDEAGSSCLCPWVAVGAR